MPKTSNPKFSIVIVAFNQIEFSKRCLETVFKNSKNYELILIDNASTDGTAEYFDALAKENGNIRVSHNSTNEGFSGPNNYALTIVKGRYLVLLNNDTEVPPDWLRHLEQPFLDYHTAAISGPTGSCCSLQAPYPSFHGSCGPVFEYVEGSCLCIPTSLARDIGLFATYLQFAYAEDLELSLRVRARGWTIHQVPFAIVHHRSQTAKNLPNIGEIQHRNHAAMLQRWGNYLQFRRFDLPFIIRRTAAIGDVLLTTPLIATIKKQQPQAEIYVETNFPELFRDNPHVAQAGSAFAQIYKWGNFINLDMAYESVTETHIIDAYFKRACFMGDEGKISHKTEIYPNESEFLAARALLGKKKWVAIHAGPTTWKGKNWPMERWADLSRWFLANNWKVLLVGTAGPSIPHFMDMRGQTNFHQLAAILRYCTLFTGVDSFPIHVAQSMGTPVVGLFGASDPRFILTDNSKQEAVCGTTDCAGERHRIVGQTYTECEGACMESIQVDQVIEAVERITK